MYHAWEDEKCLKEFNRKICKEKTTWELETYMAETILRYMLKKFICEDVCQNMEGGTIRRRCYLRVT